MKNCATDLLHIYVEFEIVQFWSEIAPICRRCFLKWSRLHFLLNPNLSFIQRIQEKSCCE